MSGVYGKLAALKKSKQDIKFFQRIISILDIGENNENIDDDIAAVGASIKNLQNHLEEFINNVLLEVYELMLTQYKTALRFDIYIGPDAESNNKNDKLYKTACRKLKPIIKIFDVKPGIYSDKFQSSKIGNDITYLRSVSFTFERDESFQNMTVTIMVRERILPYATRNGADKEIYKATLKMNNYVDGEKNE